MNPLKPSLSRRQFVQDLALACGTLSAVFPGRVSGQEAPRPRARRMTINLVCGNIGVSAGQSAAIDLANRHGFESVEAYGGYLAGLSDEQLQDLLAGMKEKRIVFGAAGLPVEFRQDEERFESTLRQLPKIARGLQRAGATRVGTWLMPCHDRLTYLQNFKQHTTRLRKVAEILRDHGLRLGLEYVGTFTVRQSRRFPFVHTMAETRELIGEIGTGNVGFVLDSWHWWQAGETPADITPLENQEIVAVDLNDAPAGIPIQEQRDGRRELPAATGVIDAKGFLTALTQVGYDGPVRAEPFNQALNAMDNDAACAATVQALKKAFALLDASASAPSPFSG